MLRVTRSFAGCCACIAVALSACLGTDAVEFEPGPPTADGLRIAKDTGKHTVYLKPGARINAYSEVVIDPIMVSYTKAADDAEPGRALTLDTETEQKLGAELRRIFIQEMQWSPYFEIVESSGPGVLRVQGWLYDLVVREPPREDPRNFPLCFGEMTLILDVRDSQTAQALARVADRVTLSCAREKRALVYTASWSDVRRSLRPWARFLRQSLDGLYELPSSGSSG